jgi:hypothetical protein
MTYKKSSLAPSPRWIAALVGVVALLSAAPANSAVLFNEPFTYADGPLATASSNVWTEHTAPPVGGQSIVSNQLLIDNSGGGDYNRPFGSTLNSGTVYAGFDLTVPAAKLPTTTGTTGPYFAHFAQALTGDSLTTAFSSRLVLHKGTANGTYGLGLVRNSFSSGTLVPTEWGVDFLPDVKQRVVLAYDLDAKVAKLWVNPATEASTSISNTTGDNLPATLAYFCTRIDGNGSAAGAKLIDNLIVGTTFSDVKGGAHPGDFDSDGDVDGADFVAWQTNFPKASAALPTEGDADGDGDVDGADFVVWQTNFPFTPGPGTAPVPEPAAWILVGLAIPAIAFRRRKSNG